MNDPTPEQLRNLADRAEHGLTPDETARLRSGLIVLSQRLKAARDLCSSLGAQLTEAEGAIERLTSPAAIRAAAFAISDYALTHLGRDLGTIHIEPMAEAGLRAALDEHQEQPGPVAHVGGNAEDCPACAGTNPPYPFICPGPKDA